MSKVCSKCNVEKELKEFNKDKSRKDGHCHTCRECRNAKMRTPEGREKRKIRVKKKYEWIQSLKTPCIFCGEADPVCVDFHHLNPEEKSFTIGGNWAKKKEDVLKEIDKCVCLCANCHRKVHAGKLAC